MNPRRSLRIGVGLAALTLASALAGALVGHRLARRQIEARADPETWNNHVTREFERIVHPTPDQSARIDPYFETAVRQLQEIRRDTIARSTNVIWRLVAEVERELTPEQRTAFEAMKPKPAGVGLEVLRLPLGRDEMGAPEE